MKKKGGPYRFHVGKLSPFVQINSQVCKKLVLCIEKCKKKKKHYQINQIHVFRPYSCVLQCNFYIYYTFAIYDTILFRTLARRGFFFLFTSTTSIHKYIYIHTSHFLNSFINNIFF